MDLQSMIEHGPAQKFVERMDDSHRAAYESLVVNLKKNLLSFQQANWAKFTDHSREHSLRIIEHLAAMIPDEKLREMNSMEVLILLSSAWLHDIGYLWKKIGEGEEPQDDMEIHSRHHELTSRYVKKNWRILFPTLPPAVSERIADVCFCHRRKINIGEVFGDKFVFIGAGTPIRARFLSALLRLSDAMDTTTERAPELILGIQDLPERSKREWQKSRLVEGIGYRTERNSIVVSSREMPSDDQRRIFMERCKELYEELRSVQDILDCDGGLRYSSMIVRTRPPEEERNASELFPNLTPTWDRLRSLADKSTRRAVDGMIEMDKYDQSVYISRELENSFRDFIASDKVGYAVVGPSGMGKSNLFCHLAKRYAEEGNLVLLYGGAFIPSADVENLIEKDLERTCLKQAAEVALKESKHFIILIDGINDYSQPDALLRYINDLIGRTDVGQVKIALSCRSIMWDNLFDYNRVSLYGSKFFTPKDGQKSILSFFNDAELTEAYQRYKDKYDLRSDLNDLSKETHEILRDPLMMRLICEAHRGKSIPPRTAIYDAFDSYYRTKIFDENTGKGDPTARDFLTDLVTELLNHHTDRLRRDYLRTNPALRPQIDDSTRGSAFVRMKDESILYEILPQQEIKFTYDRFFEYLLARRILMEPLDSERCLDLVKESEKFWALRGALTMTLVLGKKWNIMRDLAEIEDYVLRGIVIEAISSLSTHDYNATASLMRDLFRSGSTNVKRLIVLASIETRPVAEDILEQAMKDENALVRRLAVQTAYLLWTRDPDEGARVAERIASIGLLDLGRPIMESSFELQERIFMNNYRNRDAVLLVDKLGIERLLKALSRVQRMRVLDVGIWMTEQMFTKIWGWEYDKWVKPVFSLSKKDRDSTAKMLRYLSPDQTLSPRAKETIYNLAGGPLAGVMHLILIFQMQSDPFNTLPLVRQLVDSESQYRISKGLEALAFACAFFDLPESDLELVARILFAKPVHRFTIVFFGLGFSARRAGKIEFISSILGKTMEEGNTEMAVESILRLGDIGVHFPDNALSTMDSIIDWEKQEVQDALIRALANIRIFYPDKVDSFLWRRKRGLLGKIPLMELEMVPGEIFKVIDFVKYLFEKMPVMRDVFARMVEKYIYMKTKADFRMMLRFCINESVETWKDRRFVEEYLLRVQAETSGKSSGSSHDMSDSAKSE